MSANSRFSQGPSSVLSGTVDTEADLVSHSSLGAGSEAIETSSSGPLEPMQHGSHGAAGAGRNPPSKHASMPVLSTAPGQAEGGERGQGAGASPSTHAGPPPRTISQSATNYSGTQHQHDKHHPHASGHVPSATSISASIHSSSSVPDMSGGSSSRSKHRPVRQNPSRLSLAAGPRSSTQDMEPAPRQGSFDGRQSMQVSRSLTTQSSSLVSLQKTVESLMLQDSEVFRKVQSSMRGISSLAKETTKLEVGRDATGATCINQYVVVKTLGRGAFGKVKLCLNTLDGNLYAVKMVNRTFVLKQLQKPQKGLRRRVPRNPSDQKIVAPTGGSGDFSRGTGAQLTPSGSQPSDSSTLRRVASGVADPTSSKGVPRPSMDESNPLDSVMREIAVLKKLDHPNVVKLHEVIDPPGASYMMLVMEYLERGPVMETKSQTGFASFPERVALDYFRQTCAGLDYLHYNNVVHGDLKPENLLVTAAGQLKIGDFGSARMMSDSQASSKVSCTPAFQPPEALIAPGSEDPVSADVWALGVCLYCFIYGRLPFTGSCLLDISNAIRNEEVKFPPEVRLSSECVSLLQSMLHKDPSQRIDLAGVMKHPWTTEHGRAPLPSLRSLLSPPKMIEVTRNEAQAAIDRSSLVSMIRARLKEKTFQPAEYLFREGEEAHCVFMIMSGVVEIVTKLSNGVDTSVIDEMEEQSFSVDLDESFTLDCNQLVPAGLDVKDGKLHIDRQKAQELKKRMKTVLMGRQTDYVSEVKGPGQVIGEVSLDTNQIARHRYAARARDTVTVVKLTEESFFKALAQQYGDGGGPGTEDDVGLFSTKNVEENDSYGQQDAPTSTLATIHDDGDVGSL